MSRPLLPHAAALLLALAAPAAAQEAVETPDYEVLRSADGVELRSYPEQLVARVRVEAETAEEASEKGFAPLADFIFGANEPGEEIAMTAPVTSAPVVEEGGGAPEGGDGTEIAMTAPVTSRPSEEAGTWTVEFVMPRTWTLDTLPAPVNEAVQPMTIPPQTIVVAGWMGEETQEAIAQAEAAVSAFIEAEDLTPAGPFAVAGYSGPDTPVEARKWEVHRPVETPDG